MTQVATWQIFPFSIVGKASVIYCRNGHAKLLSRCFIFHSIIYRGNLLATTDFQYIQFFRLDLAVFNPSQHAMQLIAATQIQQWVLIVVIVPDCFISTGQYFEKAETDFTETFRIHLFYYELTTEVLSYVYTVYIQYIYIYI